MTDENEIKNKEKKETEVFSDSASFYLSMRNKMAEADSSREKFWATLECIKAGYNLLQGDEYNELRISIENILNDPKTYPSRLLTEIKNDQYYFHSGSDKECGNTVVRKDDMMIGKEEVKNQQCESHLPPLNVLDIQGYN